MGSRFGVQLHEAGQEVTLLDLWSEHIETVREKGLEVDNGKDQRQISIPIYYPAEVKERADIVFLFTKSMGLKKMLEDIQPILGPETKVVSLLNGIGHEDTIKHFVEEKNIFMGVTVFTAALKGPGQVFYEGGGFIEIQNYVSGKAEEEAAHLIVEILNVAGLTAAYSNNVKFSIWRKACVNGCNNAVCSLLGCNLEQYYSTEQNWDIIQQIISEFAEVAKEKEVELDVQELMNYTVKISLEAGDHYPSMYQDLVMNHRLTEIDYLNGAVARMAKERGLEAPYNQLITQLIHAKEQIVAAHS